MALHSVLLWLGFDTDHQPVAATIDGMQNTGGGGPARHVWQEPNSPVLRCRLLGTKT
jgi:hypothetical protein